MSTEVRHCCAMDIDDFGILIEGPSGSGKTSLMFGLEERLTQMGVPVRIVSDDYTRLVAKEDGVVGKAPGNIKDKAEIRGYGIVAIESVSQSGSIGLVIRLVGDDQVERMPEHEAVDMLGHSITSIKVPMRHEAGAIRIILAWLRDNSPIALPIIGS